MQGNLCYHFRYSPAAVVRGVCVVTSNQTRYLFSYCAAKRLERTVLLVTRFASSRTCRLCVCVCVYWLVLLLLLLLLLLAAFNPVCLSLSLSFHHEVKPYLPTPRSSQSRALTQPTPPLLRNRRKLWASVLGTTTTTTTTTRAHHPPESAAHSCTCSESLRVGTTSFRCDHGPTLGAPLGVRNAFCRHVCGRLPCLLSIF